MRTRFLQKVTGIVGVTAALLLAVQVVLAPGGSGQVLGESEQSGVHGGAFGWTCPAGFAGICIACTGPTCKADPRGICIVNAPGAGNCSVAAAIKQCVPASFYNWCSEAGAGVCGVSQVSNPCPQLAGFPAPVPGCAGGGGFGCGGC